MPSHLAVQMYTVRDHTHSAADLAATFEKISAIGYPAVQLSAVAAMNGPSPEVSAKQARAMLDDFGLRCIATHRSWDDLVNRTADEIEYHKIVNCDFAAIGSIPKSYAEQGADGYRRFIEDAQPIVAALKSEGIRFGYHNHAFEFMKSGIGRGTMYDLIVNSGNPDLLLELDVYWADHAGVNPLRIFQRCPGRVPVIHIKDREIGPDGQPVTAPIGEGNFDWDRIVAACRAADVEWYAIEQDVCRRDPFDCLRSSFEFLTGMGL